MKKLLSLICLAIACMVGIVANAQTSEPKLSDSEAFTLSQYESKIGELFARLQPIQQERAAFIKALNASHPGYYWYDARQQGETSGFRPIPTSTAAPALDKKTASDKK